MSNEQTTSLVWFRNDLRVQDHASLTKAVQTGQRVVGLYCFDPKWFAKDRFGFVKTGKFRTQFLLESIEGLKKNLQELNISLWLYHGSPDTIIHDLVDKLNVNKIFLQKEWTSEENEVLNSVRTKISTHIEFIESYDQFLLHPEDLPFKIETLPSIFTQFRKGCEKKWAVRAPLALPSAISKRNIIAEAKFDLPSLEDLGHSNFEKDFRSAFPFKGGENSAQQRVEDYVWKSKKLSIYKQTRNQLLGSDYSSKFSPWLANGCISARQLYWEIKAYEKEVVKNDSTYWMVFELLWRDYFKYLSLKHGNALFKLKGIKNQDYEWGTDFTEIQKWIDGATPHPFINANMKELSATGWMSNRGRQNVASYFSKQLQLDWRIGAAYFESLLIDYDVHSNYGNWQYVSGVGNDPRNRQFNISLQAERYDSNKRYQQLWLQPSLF